MTSAFYSAFWGDYLIKNTPPNTALQRNWPSALCFRWYARWRWSKYNECNPAQAANPLSAKPLGVLLVYS
jgi:hypothetical protein